MTQWLQYVGSSLLMLAKPYAMSDCDFSAISMNAYCRPDGLMTAGTSRGGICALFQPSNAACAASAASWARTSPTMTMVKVAGAKWRSWCATRSSRVKRSTLAIPPFAGRP